MPDGVTCVRCYWFKLRWKDGSGHCWKHQDARHADDQTCEHFDPKVIIVEPKPEDS